METNTARLEANTSIEEAPAPDDCWRDVEVPPSPQPHPTDTAPSTINNDICATSPSGRVLLTLRKSSSGLDNQPLRGSKGPLKRLPLSLRQSSSGLVEYEPPPPGSDGGADLHQEQHPETNGELKKKQDNYPRRILSKPWSLLPGVRKPSQDDKNRLRKSSLAHRVENVTHVVQKISEDNRLWGVGLLLIVSLAIVNAGVYAVNRFVIYERNPDWNTMRDFQTFENPLEETIKDTIPFLQKWHRSLPTDEALLPTVVADKGKLLQGEAQTDCLGRWLDDLRYNLVDTSDDGNQTLMTSSQLIERALESMGLSEQPLIRMHLDDLLHEPQPLDSLFQSSFECSSLSKVVAQLACEAERLRPTRLRNVSTVQEKSYILDSAHVALIVDRLTNVLLDDMASLNLVVDIMQTKQRARWENWIRQVYTDEPEIAHFQILKYHGVAKSLETLAKAISQDSDLFPPALWQSAVQTNILEAVKVDAVLGHEQNARVGLALAAAIRFGPTIEDHKLFWRLGKEWAEAYVSWNMVFSAGSLPPKLLSTLMLPAVSCTLGSTKAENFMAARIVSLALYMMQLQVPLLGGFDANHQSDQLAAMKQFYIQQSRITPEKSTIASALGDFNFQNMLIPIPSSDAVEGMLFTLCAGHCHSDSWKVADTNPVTRLNNDKFHVYLGYILWITVLIAGLGLELLVLLNFLHDGWSTELEVRWRFAQFLFPLLAAATLGLALMRNYMALILLVPGLWKFGFPETIMYLYFALYRTRHSTTRQRFVDLLNGVGTVVHHGAASFLIVMLLSGAIRPAQSVVNPILILLMQHWFVLLKYASVLLYTILELGLEAWFEWILISELEKIFANHWTAALAANCMLVAHWLYLLGATLDLLKPNGLTTHKSTVVGSDNRRSYLRHFNLNRRNSELSKRREYETRPVPKEQSVGRNARSQDGPRPDSSSSLSDVYV